MTVTEKNSSGGVITSHVVTAGSSNPPAPPAGTGAITPAAQTKKITISVSGCTKTKTLQWPNPQ